MDQASFSELLLDPIYAVQGVEAEVTLDGDTEATALTLIDLSEGVDIAFGTEGSRPVLRPAAAVRAQELISKGLTVEDLDGAAVSLNGAAWTVRSYKTKPNRMGEAAGEYYLLLQKAT